MSVEHSQLKSEERRVTFNLVELTEGPWKGVVHRTQEMTRREAAEINAKMSGTVIAWMEAITPAPDRGRRHSV